MASDRLSVIIDGRTLSATPGQTIIQVADAAGVYIPRFCYHEKLSVVANCRMCLVEVEKSPKPLPACATPVSDGMRVYTRSPLARRAQQGVMRFLLINHPLDCPVCDQGGECELQDLALCYGAGTGDYLEAKRAVADEDLGPLVSTDMTRCIHCTRCIRVLDEIAGVHELGATGRGDRLRIGTFAGRALESELSGNVIDVCPVGALNNKPFRMRARAWEMVARPAVSAHDATGAHLYLHSLRGEILRAVPRRNEAVNEVWLADRDRYACHGLAHAERVTEPLIRDGERWRPLDWETALDEAARALAAAHGEAVVLGSPAAPLEELHLLSALARALDAAGLDHRLAQADFSDDAWAPPPGLGCTLAELEKVDFAWLVGGRLRLEAPLIALRLRRAARAGAWVAAWHACGDDGHMPLGQGHWAAPDALLRDLLAVEAALAGGNKKKRLPAPLAELAARLAEARRPWLALGAGAVGWPNRGALHAALARLARRLDAPLAVLGPGGNARGAWLAGLRPEAGRLDARRALAAPRRLVWLWGVEPEYEAWDAAGAVDHLARSDTVIAAVAYAGPAMRRYADLILPIAAPYETPGSWLNIEGRLARAEAGAPPPGAAREGWRVLAALAARLERPTLAFERFEDLAAAAAAAVATAPAGGEPPPAAAPAAAAGGLLRVAAPSPYAWDAVLRRAAPLQATAEGRWARAFHLNPQTAAELGLEAGARVRLEQDGHAWRGELRLDARVAPGCVVTGWGEHERPPLGPAVGPVRLEAGG